MIEDVKDITSFKWATVMGIAPLSIQLDGDTAPLVLVPDSLVDPASLYPGNRVRVELSLRKVVIHGVASGSAGRGTATQRDARFGVPSTDAARVILANRQIQWFNTEMGWEESYYAMSGTSGLTVKGLRADLSGIAPGWYPTGHGPRAVVRMTAAQAQSNGQQITLWSFSVFGAYRRGGDAWFELYDSNKTLRVKQPGHYRFDGKMSFPNGSGTGVASWRGNLPAVVQFPMPLLGGYVQSNYVSELDVPMGVDYGVYFQTDAAAWTIGGDNSYMSLEYLGPALVSD